MAALRRPIALQLKHGASLWGMYVHPDWRRQGLASKLLAHMIEASKTAKIEQMELRVMEQNQDAHRFYKRHDFKETGRNVKAVKLSNNEYLNDFTMILYL